MSLIGSEVKGEMEEVGGLLVVSFRASLENNNASLSIKDSVVLHFSFS